jgi:YVTN family beta-propeller protein
MNGDARIGTSVAGYRIESVLGRGGMSVVYLAEDVRLRRKVALKLLSPELSADERFRDRFVRESQIAAGLDHPNIIPIFEAGEVDGVLFIAMRYVRGTDLKTLLRDEGPLAPDRAVEILGEVAGALDEAHAEGLVHRDVKPANVLIASGRGPESSGQVYLSDFGVTKRTSSDSGITSTGQFVGTLDYAAPEQVTGAALDGRTDVYSLGCVLYECLAGEAPFVRDAEMAVLWAHVHQPPPKVTDKRPELPPEIDAVVAKAMAKSPEDRYASGAELMAAAGAALGVRAGDQQATLVPPRRRVGRTTLIAAGAALLVLLAVIAFVVSRSGSKPAAAPSGVALAADALWRIDPGTGRVLAKIPIGKGPAGVAIGEGSVWVANAKSNTVSRVDPVTNRVVSIKVGRGPRDVAVGNGAIWVANGQDGTVSRIDPASNRVVATIRGDGLPTRIIADDEAVWLAAINVSSANAPGGRVGGVERIDPQRNVVEALIPTQGYIMNVIAVGGGAVWAGADNGVLTRIDPATNEVVAEISLEKPIAAMAFGEGSIWAAGVGFPGTVFRVDPRTNQSIATIPAGGTQVPSNEVAGIDVGGGLVWVTDNVTRTVVGIAAVSEGVIRHVSVGSIPVDVAVGQGSLWVTVSVGGTS